MLDPSTLTELRTRATAIRRHIIRMVHRANSGHVGGSLGAADLVTALYFHLMQHDAKRPDWPERDRFILSKGHCTPVLYAALAECGYFPVSELESFRRPGSNLQGHPYQPKTPGIDASTGTLGLGLSTTVGMALAGKLKGGNQTYYVLCGDGESQEGQIWEAAMFAAKYHLGNLIAFTDRNRLQTDGNTEDVMPLEPLREKWASFGWQTYEIDGHDFNQIVETVTLAKANRSRPAMIIANTIKGKGVSFMENVALWHGTPPSREQHDLALHELA